MRKIQLTNNGLNKLKANHNELKATDFEDSLKSILPGEWCTAIHKSSKESWVMYINPLIEDKFACAQLVSPFEDGFEIEKHIEKKLYHAFEKRKAFKGYEKYSRYFYGTNDGLTGLIIDRFNDKAIVQINTAGIDKYRDLIQDITAKYINGKAYMLDNAKYRAKELLPIYENENLPDISVEENELKYFLRSEIIQKVGFYFDHRENRRYLQHHLNLYNKKFKNGLDLFSYVGAWGMCALKSGVEKMTFVDQGDFEKEINDGVKINGFSIDSAVFHRADVFKKLDEFFESKQTFDLILCDPPAFAKSLSQKNSALDGYTRLHRKVFKLLEPGAVVVFSSCTHYVDHVELQNNILEAALKEGRRLSLLHSGIQGWDHPIKNLNEKSNYIKCFIYKLEN